MRVARSLPSKMRCDAQLLMLRDLPPSKLQCFVGTKHGDMLRSLDCPERVSKEAHQKSEGLSHIKWTRSCLRELFGNDCWSAR